MYNFDEMYKRFVNCNYKQCADCEYFIGNGYHAVCKMAGMPGEFCIIKKDLNKKFNIGKLIICEARDLTGRLYIRTLDDVRDYFSKDGWWNMFTLSSSEIDKEGIWLCRIKRFTYDKDGYPMNIVYPVRYIGTEAFVRNNMNAMFLLSKSKEFAVSKDFSCISTDHDRYTYYDPYSAGAYDILYDGYHKELYWLNEIRFAKHVLEEYIAGNVSLPDINSAVTAESVEFYWTVTEFEKRCSEIRYARRYRDIYPLVYKKYASNEEECWSEFINRMMNAYDNLLYEGKVNKIEPYDFTDTQMDLLDMINEVCKYYHDQYSDKKEREKAERKRKRLERRKLEKEKNKEEV